MARLHLLFFLGTIGACTQQTKLDRASSWVPAPASDLGPPVARVGQVPIFAGEVERLAERTGVGRDEALETLVRFNLLAERARSVGSNDGLPLERLKPLLVERLLARDLEPRIRPQDLPEKELRAVYDRLRKRWVHPRLVEVAVLSIYSDEAMKRDAQDRHQQTAADLGAFLKRTPPRSESELLAIAARPEWATRKVQSTRLWQSDSEPFSRLVGAEVQKLSKPGQLTPLVRDEAGYHVAIYIGERPSENVPFEVAQSEIRAQLYPSWRDHQFLAMTKSLLDEHNVQVRLDGLRKPARP